jgi:hypothetical protein
MPATPPVSYLELNGPFSYASYVGDGTTEQFSISFPYLDREHIFVTVAGEDADFTFLNDGAVSVSPAPAADAEVIVGRRTPAAQSSVTHIEGSLLRGRDLNRATLQLLYSLQESADGAGSTAEDLKGDLASVASGAGAALLGFAQGATGAVSRTALAKMRERVSLLDFIPPNLHAAIRAGTSTEDLTAYIQAAVDSGEALYAPTGRYCHKGIDLRAGLTLIGDGHGTTEFFLLDDADTHSFMGVNTDDVTLIGFKVSGNKAGQLAGNDGRGIYFVGTTGTCSRIHLERVWVDDAEDHGVFFSTNAGLDSAIYHCIATNNGDGTGPGGTGFLLGKGSTIVGCYAEGNALNGFKSGTGVHIGCVSKNNSGGFETGFGSYDAGNDYAMFQNCRAIDCGGGFRNQGEGRWLIISNCVAEGCNLSGLELVNNVRNVIINGFISRNNGQSFTRTESVGGDGISIIESSGQPMDILIDNFMLIDDQGSPTQDYGIYIDASAANVNIGSGIIRGNVSGPLRVASANTNDIRISPQCIGLDVNANTVGDAVVTGTTSTTTLRSLTIPTRTQIHVGTTLIVRGGGFVTGTAGTKTIRLAIAAGADIISSQTAGEAQVFGFEYRLKWENSTTLHILGQCIEDGGAAVNLVKKQTANMSGDITIAITGQLGNAADSITLDFFEVVTAR